MNHSSKFLVHTLAKAKLDLANKEAAERTNGMIARHEMSPSNYILAVFDIEAKLYIQKLIYYSWQLTHNLSSAALDKRGQNCSQTVNEKAFVQIKRNQLHHHMQTFLGLQKIYIPDVAALEAHESARRTGEGTTSSYDDTQITYASTYR
jgi:hypothetical protein